jgi:hypothetical protein
LTTKRALLAIWLLTGAIVFSAGAYELPWYKSGLPDLVVVGKLVDQQTDVAYFDIENSRNPDLVNRHFMNTGFVEVDSVLQGEPGQHRIPVIWHSRTVLFPTYEGGVREPSEQSPPIGVERIWVLSKPGKNRVGFENHRGFRHFPGSKLEETAQILEALRKGEKVTIPKKKSDTLKGRYHLGGDS